MKKFVGRFCLWLLILLLLAVGVDAMITVGLRKVDTRKYGVWNDIYKDEINADMVVLGNSQTWCSYNTYLMDSLLDLNSYNLGIDGHSLQFQLIRYKTYRRYNPKPKAVLLNVCYFGTFYIMSDEQYEREQFFPYVTDATLMSTVAETKHLTWFDRYLPLYRYFGYRDDIEMGMASFFGKREFPDGGLHKGFRGNDYSWETTGVLQDSLKSVIDENQVRELENFAEDCRKEGIALVFVKYPVCYPIVERVSNLRVTDSIFDAIAKRNNVSVLDYYHAAITKDRSNYYNYNHLNKKGSELFTKELCNDLDSLGILSGL